MGKSIGHVWTPAKTQLYNVLPKLVRDGLASQRVVRQERRPDKVLYAVTSDGQEALERWLNEPDPGSRDAFYLRLFVGALADPDSLLEHVRQHRTSSRRNLRCIGRSSRPTRGEATTHTTGSCSSWRSRSTS